MLFKAVASEVPSNLGIFHIARGRNITWKILAPILRYRNPSFAAIPYLLPFLTHRSKVRKQTKTRKSDREGEREREPSDGKESRNEEEVAMKRSRKMQERGENGINVAVQIPRKPSG